jgi:hypothetical protein
MKAKNCVFYVFLLLFVCTACNTKKSNDIIEDQPVVKPEAFHGIWVSKNKKKWFEFHTDGTFRYGQGDMIMGDKHPFRLDSSENLITLQGKKGEREFLYSFEKSNQLKLQQPGKDRAFLLFRKK